MTQPKRPKTTKTLSSSKTKSRSPRHQAQGPLTDLALHTLGWKAFQDLCAQTCEEVLKRPIEIYREAQDGGQDAVFLSSKLNGLEDAHPATIQCKFSSKAGHRLTPSDLTVEESHISTLKNQGQAETYVLMTNLGVDAPVAVAIKKRLRELGVINPHVFGKEFLTRVIRANSRLRSLVPRVYGLGDLSLILDVRQADQTKALLGHMLPTLKAYVPTQPHRAAVQALAKHGIVLLLGDPATGKSTIAAILATAAVEHAAGYPCYKSDGPEEFIEPWNPHEAKGFHWIDDAFGPNQPRDDFIDRWIAIMPKVQTAIAGGHQFVLTSRRHIYEAAKTKLGSRNHPLFRNRQAIVDVGVLTTQEREQILYNHIKVGNQTKMWKSRVKPQLNSLANETTLLPEIARRLADRAYTEKLSTAYDALVKFIREPKEHLLQTIQELSQLHRAALTLVFLHRGHLPVGGPDPIMQELVLRHYSVNADSLGQALLHLRESFLVQVSVAGRMFWSFKHPTIADAISAMLGETDGMGELYLRGTKSETIIAEAVCIGAADIPDAVAIPEMLDDLLVERLAEVPDEPMLNRALFAFLYERASTQMFRKFIDRHPGTLARVASMSYKLINDPTMFVRARAHSLGLLQPEFRDEAATKIERAIIDDGDVELLADETILELLPAKKLLHLSTRVRDEVLGVIPAIAETIAEEADLEREVEYEFDEINSKLTAYKEFFENDGTAAELLEEAEAGINAAMECAKKNKAKYESKRQGEDWEWQNYSPGQSAPIATSAPTGDIVRSRSIFSDVDE